LTVLFLKEGRGKVGRGREERGERGGKWRGDASRPFL